MPSVLIPTPYRGPTNGKNSIEVDGETVRACLLAVENGHPGFLDLVLNPTGEMHRFVKIFINKAQIDGSELDRAVEASDEIEVLAAIAGG